ncbi:hypothetical protein DFA_06661 [Cavenderia fasciculata]|uniref:Uncharacterized protein n=1 Tax=Cavenderia fasciculata TaxID=261658 RepID=F4Q1X5_CACFS|nr:uncharacterized protein DFA_06661 [Cavenderia fasciculata]EGG17995.1 hypothetical protein DFA_06661 [Cavenderia fasciculata]|eukprot:XP_004356888.1 hypothetical protein DFA_06661 [Cavenderia fasciculata]
MKKTWIFSLEEECKQERVIVVDSKKVSINGVPITAERVQGKLHFSVSENGEFLNNHHGGKNCYTVIRDLGLKSLGLNKRLYLNNVDVENGHILNSRRNVTLFDVALLALLFIIAAAVSTIASIVMIPLIFITYFFIYRNKVVHINKLPIPKYIDGVESTTVGPSGATCCTVGEPTTPTTIDPSIIASPTESTNIIITTDSKPQINNEQEQQVNYDSYQNPMIPNNNNNNNTNITIDQ